MTIHLKRINRFGGGGASPTPPTPTPQGEYFVKVIDYDGTVLDEQWLDDGAEYTLPSAPSHTGLVFQEWSSSETITDGKITIDKNNVMIGAIYTTVSGQSEFDIEINTGTGLSVYLAMNGTKDWGDGVTDSNNSHTYSQAGQYTIKCNGTSITNTPGSNNICGGASSSSGTYNYLQFWLKRVRLANVQQIPNTAFSGLWGLETITIPKETTNIGVSCFQLLSTLKTLILPKGTYTVVPSIYGCYSLLHYVIPNNVTDITSDFQNTSSLEELVIPNTVSYINATYCFYMINNVKKIILNNISLGSNNSNMFGIQTYYTTIREVVIRSMETNSLGSDCFRMCALLDSFDMPNNITTIGNYCFANCLSLKKVTLSDNLTAIPTYCFSSCRSLEKIVIPQKVTSIGEYAFGYCDSLVEYDFSNVEVVPTLANSNAFQQMNKRAVIKVPSGLYDQWITETNWSALADYIVSV